MTDQIIDKKTVAIPGPMGDVTPAALAAKNSAAASASAASSSASAAAASAASAQAAPASDANVAARIASGALTRAALDSAVSSLASAPGALHTSLHDGFLPRAHKALFIGDSYSVGFRATDPSTKGWVPITASLLGLDVVNYAVGGSGWVTSGDSRTFGQQINKAASDGISPDVVFIAGGRNDGDADVSAAATAALAAARSAWPEARIIVVPGMWDHRPVPNTLIINAAAAASAARAVGAEVIWSAWQWNFGHDEWSFDLGGGNLDMHPNDAGYARIAQYVVQGVRGRPTGLSMPAVALPAWNNSVPGQNARCMISDGLVTIGGYFGSGSSVYEGWDFTQVPKSARPSQDRFFTGAANGGGTAALLAIRAADGVIKINNIYGTPGRGVVLPLTSYEVGS